MKGIIIRGDEKTAGGGDKEERVSNLGCPAQHVTHSADSSEFEHKMLTDQKKLRTDQDTFKYNNGFTDQQDMLRVRLDKLVSK